MGGLKSNGRRSFLHRFRSSKKNRSKKELNPDSNSISNRTPTKQRPDDGNTTPPLSPASYYTDSPQAYKGTFDKQYGSTATADNSKASQGQEGAEYVDPMGRVKDMPSAKEAAFSGPPRYDWIDIETAAAVKVQSTYRRNKVMSMLEREGKSTAAMRNRARARKTKQRSMVNEDVPSALRFCGIGFLFGDATGEDQDVLNAQKQSAFAEKKKARELEEEEKRKFRFRQKECEELVEGVEVVEDT